MSIWFFIVMVIGIGYALNRLTSTSDLPVSTRLAQAREIVEQGRRRRTAANALTLVQDVQPAEPVQPVPGDQRRGRSAQEHSARRRAA